MSVPAAAATAPPQGPPPGRIAYQGEPGCNGHAACREVLPDWEPVAAPTFEEVFALVERGEVARAMIPLENSLAGRVADIHHLLPRSGMQIVGEHFLRIRFELLGLPGATIEGARTVHSHVHALGQCRRLITEHGLRAVVAGDTAGSAREVAEAGDPTRLSLAPPGAAELYGLEILARDVEDDDRNTTRFLVLEPATRLPRRDEIDGPVMSTLIFTTRNLPAALYKALGGFATNGVNMTRLESYLDVEDLAASTFIADIEGHPDDPSVARALEELGFFTADLRVLGVYAAHSRRGLV